MIRDFADAGNGVIVISSELPELLAVSDRVADHARRRVDGARPQRDPPTKNLHHAVQGVGRWPSVEAATVQRAA